jgi:hypothetical protein
MTPLTLNIHKCHSLSQDCISSNSQSLHYVFTRMLLHTFYVVGVVDCDVKEENKIVTADQTTITICGTKFDFLKVCFCE